MKNVENKHFKSTDEINLHLSVFSESQTKIKQNPYRINVGLCINSYSDIFIMLGWVHVGGQWGLLWDQFTTHLSRLVQSTTCTKKLQIYK